MAYISQEEKAKVAPAVKALLKKYNLKGSLSINNHSTLVLTIKAGEIDFASNYNKFAKQRAERTGEEVRLASPDRVDVNPYWFQDQFDGDAKDFLTAAHAALKGQDWFDNSDIQTDYFHVKHYVSVQVGKWNKPYTLVTA